MASSSNTKKHLLTREGLAQIIEELRILKEERRVEVAEKLREAISYGDLSENSEYDDARNMQAQIEIRIQELETIVKNHEIIDSGDNRRKQKKIGTVSIGSIVTILSIANNDKDTQETIKIVGSTEVNVFDTPMRISNESPLGSSLIGSTVGDIVSGKASAGEFQYQVIEVC